MNINTLINSLATIKNAQEYQEESDKFVFCIDLLGISAHNSKSEKIVNMLEDEFERLLGI